MRELAAVLDRSTLEFLVFLIFALMVVRVFQGGIMAGEVARLREEVAEIKGEAASLRAMVGRIAQFIRDNAANPAELLAFAEELNTESEALRAAQVANADVDPGPPPPTP